MSFYWLLKREWLEHGSSFYWAAGITVALLFASAVIISMFDARMEVSPAEFSELSERLDDDQRHRSERDANGNIAIHGLETFAAMALDVAGSTDEELKEKMGIPLDIIERIFHWILMVVTLFALTAVLYDERKDQSVLFWKSMPVSDTRTVLSKWVFVAWIAPVVTVLAVLVGQLIVVVFTSAAVEDGMGGRIWQASQIWSRPFASLFGYFVHSLWALPVYAWVMLVSAFAGRAPLLWAIGLPWILIWWEGIVFGSSNLARWIFERIEARALPYVNSEHPETTLDVLLSPALLVSVVIGAAMLALTIYCRRRFTEI